MVGDNSINIIIAAVDKTKEAFKTAEANLESINKKGEAWKKSLSGWQPVFKGMAIGGGIAFGAISAAIGFSVKAYGEAEAAMARVDTMIKNTAATAKLGADGFNIVRGAIEVASKAAIQLGFDDEAVAESIAKMYQRTGSYTQAIELNNLAMDLSRNKNIDLASASSMVNLVLSGNARALKQYGLVLNENTTPMEQLIELQKLLEGSAKNATKTFQVQAEILKIQFENIREAVGKPFAEALSSLLTKLQPVLDRFVKWTEANPELVRNILLTVGAISGLILGVGLLGMKLPALILGVQRLGAALVFLQANPILLLISALVIATITIIKFKDQIAIVIGEIIGFGLEIARFVFKMLGMTEQVRILTNEIRINDEVIQRLRNHISDNSKATGDLSISQSDLAKAMAQTTDYAGEMGDKLETVLGIAKDKFQEVVSAGKALQDQIKAIDKDLAKIETDYQKESLSNKENFEEEAAKIVVDAQNELAELKFEKWTKLREGADAEELNALDVKIAQQQTLLNNYVTYNLGIEAEVAEAKRFSQMDELEQLMFTYQKKDLMRQVEMLTEKLAKLQEKKEAKEQLDAILIMFGAEKAAFVQKEIDKTKTFIDKLEEQKKALGSWVLATVSLYQSMAAQANAAIASIRSPSVGGGISIPVSSGGGGFVGYGGGGGGGFQAGTDFVPKTDYYMLHRGETVIPSSGRKGLGGIVVNILGGTYLSTEVAEDIGNKIIDKLKLQFNV